MTRCLWIIALALAASGCGGRSSSGPTTAGGPTTAAGPTIPFGPATGGPGEVLEIQEAAFRYRLQKLPTDVKAYLAVDGKDPSPELLKRLNNDWPNLEPASKEPKEKGMRLYVAEFRWINPGRAEIKAGHWTPTKFGGEGYFATHLLMRGTGKWTVEKITNETMS